MSEDEQFDWRQDQIDAQEKYEEYRQDAITDFFLESHPNRTINLSLSIGLLGISLEQNKNNSCLSICDASVFHQREINEFLTEFKSYLMEMIDLHKISNEERRKPRKPKFHERELSKTHNEIKISIAMKFLFETKTEKLEWQRTEWFKIQKSCDDKENENGEFLNTCGLSGFNCLPGNCPYTKKKE